MRTETAILLGWLVVDVVLIGILWLAVKRQEPKESQEELDEDWGEYIDSVARKNFVNRRPLADIDKPFALDNPEDPPRPHAA